MQAAARGRGVHEAEAAKNADLRSGGGGNHYKRVSEQQLDALRSALYSVDPSIFMNSLGIRPWESPHFDEQPPYRKGLTVSKVALEARWLLPVGRGCLRLGGRVTLAVLTRVGLERGGCRRLVCRVVCLQR